MNIKFNQPKYVVPMIILPFSFALFYLVKDAFGGTSKNDQVQLEELNSINTSLPDANLDKFKMKDKFESFMDAFKYQRDFTAVNNIDLSDTTKEVENQSRYSTEERMLIDSISNSIIDGTRKDFKTSLDERVGRSTKPKSSSPKTTNIKEETEYEREMRLFRDQMMLLDSLTKSPEEREAAKRAEMLKKKQEEQLQEKEELVHVSKSNIYSGTFFNTIKADKTDMFIRAIIDEGIKVFDGSRIRIRLMEDINAGGHLVPKGSYLFGTVSGFKAQRVEITVNSLLIDNQILPVELVVYDNDGMKGLYVPASQFRELTKDLVGDASSSRVSFDEDPSSAAEFFFGAAEKAVQSTSRALNKSAKKNKALIKYNSIIYLINPNELKNK